MKDRLDMIAAEAERLAVSRPGISVFLQRERDRLSGRLSAANELPEGEWRNMSVRALLAQADAVLAEVMPLRAPLPHTRGYEHG